MEAKVKKNKELAAECQMKQEDVKTFEPREHKAALEEGLRRFRALWLRLAKK